MSSGLGYTPTATEPGYVTTKAAVLALAQCLRADWQADGVGVSAICPGVINTGIIDSTRFLGVDERSKARARRAFRRGHKPEQVAAAIVRAVERNKPVVPVGFEAWLGWWAHRYAPVRRAAARRPPRRPQVTFGRPRSAGSSGHGPPFRCKNVWELLRRRAASCAPGARRRGR